MLVAPLIVLLLLASLIYAMFGEGVSLGVRAFREIHAQKPTVWDCYRGAWKGSK